jgi:hypothetical protein
VLRRVSRVDILTSSPDSIRSTVLFRKFSCGVGLSTGGRFGGPNGHIVLVELTYDLEIEYTPGVFFRRLSVAGSSLRGLRVSTNTELLLFSVFENRSRDLR